MNSDKKKTVESAVEKPEFSTKQIRILKQPDGKYAVWSQIFDDYLRRDLDAGELEEWYIEYRSNIARKMIQWKIENADIDNITYESPPHTYHEAQEIRRENREDNSGS